MSYVIFTDLDGTFLNHETYSFKEAEGALNIIKSNNIPLVFVTSKTKSEIEQIIRQINYDVIFSVENGAAVYFPNRDSKIFGKNLVEALCCAQKIKTRFDIKTIFDFDDEKLSEMTQLPVNQIKFMKQRDFTLPFLMFENELENISTLAKECGFKILKGGRFFHMVAREQDKGIVVKYVIDILEKQKPNITTVGLGDSGNDFELLKNVDLPVVVRKYGGVHDKKLLDIKGAYHTKEVGPKGFSEFVLRLLKGGHSG